MAERMRVGAVVEGYGLPPQRVLDAAEHAENIGMDAIWLSQLPNQTDVGTLVTGLAMATTRVTVGSAVVPMYTRPPVVMAQSALTADELSGGRTILGLGLGYRAVGDWMVGGKLAPAIAGTREYLTIVNSLIRSGEVSFDGRWYSGHAMYSGKRREDLPVYLGAFGPKMIELAGEVADGVILWMCSVDYIVRYAMPALRRGWQRRGGRPPTFRVAAILNAAVTPEPDRDRELYGRLIASDLRVSTYRTLFQTSGFTQAVATGRPDDEIIDALGAFGVDQLAVRMAEFRQAGIDEMAVATVGTAVTSPERCRQTLSAAWDVAQNLGSELELC